MTIRVVVACLLFSTLPVGEACAHTASGTYIAKFTDGAYLLQIVQTGTGALSGQLETITVPPDGKLKDDSFSVSGAADGNEVSIAIRPNAILPVVVSAAGKLDGDRLTLLIGSFAGSGGSQTVVFNRGEIGDFQAQANFFKGLAQRTVEEREAVAAKVKAAKDEQDFISTVDRLTGSMERFVSKSDANLAAVRAIGEQYRSITRKMAAYLDQERGLARNANAGVARGQIDVAINQGGVASNQIQVAAISFKNSFESATGSIGQVLPQIDQKCRLPNESASKISAGTANKPRSAVCGRLQAIQPKYMERKASLIDALADLDDVYRLETSKQNHIEAESAALE